MAIVRSYNFHSTSDPQSSGPPELSWKLSPLRKRIYQVLLIISATSPALGPNVWLLMPALLRLMFKIYSVPTFISHSFLLLKIIIENFITVRL